MFNLIGYFKFRNLVKIFRFKRKRKIERVEGKEKVNRGSSCNEFVVVEVVEDRGGDEDFEGLLGEGYGGSRGRWRGLIRLLFLDERYFGDEEV